MKSSLKRNAYQPDRGGKHPRDGLSGWNITNQHHYQQQQQQQQYFHVNSHVPVDFNAQNLQQLQQPSFSSYNSNNWWMSGIPFNAHINNPFINPLSAQNNAALTQYSLRHPLHHPLHYQTSSVFSPVTHADRVIRSLGFSAFSAVRGNA